MYVGWFCTIGLMKKSRNSEKGLVGLEQALTIGHPTNFVLIGGFLCTFGNRYHCGVRVFIFLGLRNSYVSKSICLSSYIHVTVSYIFW